MGLTPDPAFRNRLAWRTSRTVTAAGVTLPVAEGLEIETRADAGRTQSLPGIRPNTPRQMLVKRLAWPIQKFTDVFRGLPFTQRVMGKWIRRHAGAQTTFLEIGPGDMSMRRFVPRSVAYNALDFAVSEFQVRRVVARDPRVNLVIASVTDIPLPDSCVDMLAAIEMLQQVDEIDRALSELVRVCRPGAKVIISIGNGRSYKYARRGPNPWYVHHWTYEEFRALAERHGLHVLNSRRMMVWVPLPEWLARRSSFHLPVSARDDFYNCYFLYLFEVKKPSTP